MVRPSLNGGPVGCSCTRRMTAPPEADSLINCGHLSYVFSFADGSHGQLMARIIWPFRKNRKEDPSWNLQKSQPRGSPWGFLLFFDPPPPASGGAIHELPPPLPLRNDSTNVPLRSAVPGIASEQDRKHAGFPCRPAPPNSTISFNPAHGLPNPHRHPPLVRLQAATAGPPFAAGVPNRYTAPSA